MFTQRNHIKFYSIVSLIPYSNIFLDNDNCQTESFEQKPESLHGTKIKKRMKEITKEQVKGKKSMCKRRSQSIHLYGHRINFTLVVAS